MRVLVGAFLGLLFMWLVHRLVAGELVFEPTRKGIFAMELAVFVLILAAFVTGEIRRLIKSKGTGLQFRDIALLLTAFAGSSLIYIGVVSLAGLPTN